MTAAFRSDGRYRTVMSHREGRAASPAPPAPPALPAPEAFFQDESRIEFRDPERLLGGDNPERSVELLLVEMQREMVPLERHRLDAYYEDGPEHLVGAMKLRELLAMKQHQSGTPVRRCQVIEEIVRGRGAPPGRS